MAVNLTITLDTTATRQDLGPGRGAPSGRVQERIKIVGAAANALDTGTYVPAYCHSNCQFPDGDFFVSAETTTIGGTSLTITAVNALGSSTVYTDLEGQF
jgi:hypothetical protein